MSEGFEKVQNNQKRVMEQLRNINLDALRQELARIEQETTKKSEFDSSMKKFVEFNQIVTNVNKTVMDVEKEAI